jgi:hypothetical protein
LAIHIEKQMDRILRPKEVVDLGRRDRIRAFSGASAFVERNLVPA